MRWRAAGGWSFAVDPDRSAAEAPALWRPSDCTFVTIAEPAPPDFPAIRPSNLCGLRIAAEALTHRDWHLVLAAGGNRHRIWIRGCAADERLAYLSPAGDGAAARFAAAAALHHQVGGAVRGRPPACALPGTTERWRLAQWLRLLDAQAGGAAARDLAASLLAADARAYSAADWDASSERRRIARWQRAAVAMRDGGYRALLAPR